MSSLMTQKHRISGTWCGIYLFVLMILLCSCQFSSETRPESVSSSNNPTIPRNVFIAGVPVGGLSREEALEAVKKTIPFHLETSKMVLELPNRRRTLSAADIQPHWDWDQAFAEAFSADGNAEERIELNVAVNDAYLMNKLNEILEALGGTFLPTTYHILGDIPDLEQEDPIFQTIDIQKGHSGLQLNIQEIYQQVLDAYKDGSFIVNLKEPGPILNPEPFYIEEIWSKLYIAPTEPELDRQTRSVVPGIYGYGFDLNQAEETFREAKPGEMIHLSCERIPPQKRDEEVYFQDVLGNCRTPHNDNENRNTNLELACSMINGKILQPGEILSYNEALGKRTADKGYLPAPAYSGTELVDEVGGGICQVSSTLYLSALFAELQIVERKNHGFPVDYIPIGLDATVNWGTTDLKIQNNYDFPIQILAEVTDGFVWVRIMGLEIRDYTVKIEHRVEGPRFASAYLCYFDPETDKEISRKLDHESLYLDVVWQNPDYAENDRIVTYR